MIERGALTTGALVREACRSGTFSGHTSGLASGFAQANLVVLPAEVAGDFHEFCRRNPKPCPLLDVTEPGSPTPTVPRPRPICGPTCPSTASGNTASWRTKSRTSVPSGATILSAS